METETIESTNTLPAAIQKADPAEVFADRALLAVMITEVEKIVEDGSHGLDVANEEDRATMKSLAYQVSRTKTFLDDKGKELVSDWKAKARAVDSHRKCWRDTLDALRDQAKAPVVEWEAAEDQRIARHAERMELFSVFTDASDHDGVVYDHKTLVLRLGELAKHRDEWKWEEFAEMAEERYQETLAILTKLVEERKLYEEAQAELEQLRAEKAEREEQERREAEAKRQQEQHERMQREANERAEKDAQVAIAKAEREKAAAEEAQKLAEQRAQEESDRREREAAEEAERREQAAQEAVEAEKLAVEQAAREEREKIEREQREKAEAEAARQADEKHRAMVNAHVANQLEMTCNVDLETAAAIVLAISEGHLDRVRIEY
ncbi:hypothetical protein [uncultured Paraglaciecola sp.]|uniref:hypothetical protein n=1 Tax=uncultured Paraglaciecola sp. TaxID=1765024 RepID=UPI00260ABB07|nr:hypothetical protein [uncultured Paraglaciecola sp.]